MVTDLQVWALRAMPSVSIQFTVCCLRAHMHYRRKTITPEPARAWELGPWGEYMTRGKVTKKLVSKPPHTSQHLIFNMSCLEIGETRLADQIQLLVLQQQFHPTIRYLEQLQHHNSPTVSLYAMSTKAGAFSVSRPFGVLFALAD